MHCMIDSSSFFGSEKTKHIKKLSGRIRWISEFQIIFIVLMLWIEWTSWTGIYLKKFFFFRVTFAIQSILCIFLTYFSYEKKSRKFSHLRKSFLRWIEWNQCQSQNENENWKWRTAAAKRQREVKEQHFWISWRW